jgi:hypothetical protein
MNAYGQHHGKPLAIMAAAGDAMSRLCICRIRLRQVSVALMVIFTTAGETQRYKINRSEFITNIIQLLLLLDTVLLL